MLYDDTYKEAKRLQKRISHLEHEKRAIDFYLRHHRPRPWKSERLTTEKSQYQELLNPVFESKNQKFQEWATASYTTNSINTDQLIHDTPTDIKVRSKSEALIAMVLHNNKQVKSIIGNIGE